MAVGTATDPYQPIEGHYKLTRGSLEALLAGRTPIGLVTKGPMVVRDADLLAELGRRSGCTVCMSVPTVDEDAWRALEPGTAHPLQRLRAVRRLRDSGVNAGVLMAPVVPGFTTQPSKLEATIKAIADHGAAFMGANVMYLKGGTKDHFMGFLAKEFPQMVESYNRLYAGAYAKADYVKAVRGMIDTLQERYDARHGGAPRAARRGRTRGQQGKTWKTRPPTSRRPLSGTTNPVSKRYVKVPILKATVARIYAVAASAKRPAALVTSISTLPSRTAAVNSSPSVQRWLIGSLMRVSITRLRNRAPYARL